MEEILHRFNPWWTEPFAFPGVAREAYLAALERFQTKRDVVLITGLRRVGKTTLMYQLIHRLLKTIEPTRVFYVSLDHLALKDRTILELVEGFRALHGHRHDEQVYLFLDEVHFKPDYELQLKNLYDAGHAKVNASGSASLDLIMKSPTLTGRQRMVRLAPLSFREYLRFTNQEVSPADTHLYQKLAEEYVETGGMPEYVLTKDPNVLQALIDTLLYRDIAGQHNLRKRENLLDILLMVAQSAGSPVSIRKISRVLGIPLETVGKIVGLFVEANLIHIVEKEGKVSERKASPAKLYLADTGFFGVLIENVNRGARVENAIYLALRRSPSRQPLRYHLQAGKEVDFVRGGEAWEVKYKDQLEERDYANLASLSGYTNRTLVTKNKRGQQERLTVTPAWKLLLEADN